MENCGDI